MVVRLVFKFLGVLISVLVLVLVMAAVNTAGGYAANEFGAQAQVGIGMDALKTYVIVKDIIT